MILVVDIETTGSNPSCDEIFNIGIVSIEQNRIKDSYEFFFRISQELSFSIERLTRKNFKLLKNYPSFREKSEEIYNILNKAELIVAHNKNFDFKFLNAQFKKFLGKELHCKSECTQEMVKRFFPDLICSNLKYLATYFLHESFANFHNALEDATLCAKIYLLFSRNDFFPKTMEQYHRIDNFFQIQNYGKPFLDLKSPELLLSSLLKNKIALQKFFPLKSQVFFITVIPSLFFEEISIYYPSFNKLKTYHIGQKKLILDLKSYSLNNQDTQMNFPYTMPDIFFINKKDLCFLLESNSFVEWFYSKKTFYKGENFFIHNLI